MLQRIGIAQALVNDPKLLFFDEPTSGLDPIAHAEIRDLILRLRDEGRTVFLSSHQLSDVEMVCDRVAILNRGKLLRLGRLDEMLAGGCMEIKAENVEPKAVDKIKAAGAGVRMEDGRVVITQDEGKGVDQVIDAIRAGRGHILSVIPQRRSLEDLFVETIREGCE
jgi:ABC-2 type transport system ATP-binding protein